MAQLIPYITFDGNCREAMNFYQSCLGGELQLQTVGEMPEMAAQMPPHMKEAIMHSMLISGKILLMASDLNRNGITKDNAYSLCLNCVSEEELNQMFSALSEGGNIVQPVSDMPWGKYGELTDRYGKQWLFNYSPANMM
jgi:PhnB protein